MTLDTLDEDELERAIGVLAAYVGAGRRRSEISTAQAERLGGRFSVWMQTDLLTKEYEARVIDALAVLEPNVALNIARKRIQLIERRSRLACWCLKISEKARGYHRFGASFGLASRRSFQKKA